LRETSHPDDRRKLAIIADKNEPPRAKDQP
jgi:hypothetical protein